MARRSFSVPFVFDDDDLDIPDNPVVTGGASGQAGQNPFPCTFTVWQGAFGTDLDDSGAVDIKDYVQWWKNNGFSRDQWLSVGNSEDDWNTYFGNPEP